MNLLLGMLTIIAVAALIGGLSAWAIAAMLREKHGTSGALSAAALNVQSLLEPEKKKVVETMQEMEERSESDESGGREV